MFLIRPTTIWQKNWSNRSQMTSMLIGYSTIICRYQDAGSRHKDTRHEVNTMTSTLSANLKSKRQALHLSRKSVAESIGISASTLADYENGHATPSIKALVKLSTLYDCSTDYLLGLEKKESLTIDVTGLSDDQIRALQGVVDSIRR